MAARSLTRGELISVASALVLLIAMLVLAWYDVDGIPGHPGSRVHVTTTETGWEGLTGLRWLVLLTVIIAFAVLAAHAVRPSRHAVAGLRLTLLVLASGTALALIVRVLIDLPASDRIVDQKVGAIVGMLAAIGLAYGAWDAVREQRARLVSPTAGSGGETSSQTATTTGTPRPRPS